MSTSSTPKSSTSTPSTTTPAPVETDPKPTPADVPAKDTGETTPAALGSGTTGPDKTASEWLKPLDAEIVDEPAETNKAKRERLTRELAEAEAQAQVVKADPPDKLIILAGGEICEISGAVPTHHASTQGGYALPVVEVLPHPNAIA